MAFVDRVAGQRGRLFTDQLLFLGGTQLRQVVRALSGQQFIQNDANGIQIAPGVGGLAEELFWRGICWGVRG